MNLTQIVETALLTASNNVWHYHALNASLPYIVWMEEGSPGYLKSDNHVSEISASGTIHFFTEEENDPIVAMIEHALDDAQISFRLNSVQFEEDTGIIHYEWVWEVV